MFKSLKYAGLQPQAPSLPPTAVGQKLLSLIRTIEKYPSNQIVLREAVACLQHLTAQGRQFGLLKGDSDVAEKIMSSISTNRSSKKRARAEQDASESGPALDIELVWSSLTRVLNNPNQDLLIVVMATNLCTTVSEFLQDRQDVVQDRCFMAEYELVARSAKQLLSGVLGIVRNQLQQMPRMHEVWHLVHRDEVAESVTASLRMAASFVQLFGTRLSRNTDLLDGLHEIAWKCIGVTDPSVTETAARLYASLPLAGGNNTTPSLTWKSSVDDSLSFLSMLIRLSAPIVRLPAVGTASTRFQPILQIWENALRNTESQEDRLDLFVHSIQAMRLVISNLFQTVTSDGMFGTELNVSLLLNFCEVLIAFSTTSESLYFGTKKRLRAELVQEGLLTCNSLVQCANFVKMVGIQGLSDMIQIFGLVLLPYSSRIHRITTAAVLSSSSTSVRQAMDPASPFANDGKRVRWLNAALSLRIASIETFRSAVLMFGLPKEPQMHTGVSLVSFCMIDQLVEIDRESGDRQERANLVKAAADCLSGCLLSSGPYMSTPTRGIVDSVANACLIGVRHELSLTADEKIALLRLGSACLMVPWPCGSASSIGPSLAACSQKWQRDGAVALAALEAHRVCDMFCTPRAPAMYVSAASISRDTTTMVSLLEKLVAMRQEAHDIERLMQAAAIQPARPAVATATECESLVVTQTELPRRQEGLTDTKLTHAEQNPTVLENPSIDASTGQEPLSVVPPTGEDRLASGSTHAKQSYVKEDDCDEIPDIVDCDPDADDQDSV